MTITQKPITLRTKTADRSPIGTRYVIGESTYTLVAYSHSRNGFGKPTATPVLVSDYDLDAPRTEWDILSDGSLTFECPESLLNDLDEILEVAPEDPERSDRARAAALKRYNEAARSTADQWEVLSFDDLTTDQEFAAFVEFTEAELRLRKAQAELERAARERSEWIARIADLKGSQQAAARTLGVNQSTVSRALRERPERP